MHVTALLASRERNPIRLMTRYGMVAVADLRARNRLAALLAGRSIELTVQDQRLDRDAGDVVTLVAPVPSRLDNKRGRRATTCPRARMARLGDHRPRRLSAKCIRRLIRCAPKPDVKAPPVSNLLALALGAAALGAVAIGALAIGRLVVGRLVIKNTRLSALEVDELTVRRLRVVEHERPISEPSADRSS